MVPDKKLCVMLRWWPVLLEIMRRYGADVWCDLVINGGWAVLLKQMPTSVPGGWALFYERGPLDFESAFIISD